MTIDAEPSLVRTFGSNNTLPPPISTRKKNPHNRTQSISTQPVTQKKKHGRRGSLPIQVHELHKLGHSPLFPPPLSPLPGTISIQIANPQSNVAAYNVDKHKKYLQNLTYIFTWYFFSTSLSLYNKNLMGRDRFNFNFPLLVSAIHAAIHSVITMLMMSLGGSRWRDRAGNKMTLHDYFYKVVSMCCKKKTLSYFFLYY